MVCRLDAAFGDEEDVLRYQRPQAAARIEGYRKVLEVAVIDADDAGADGDGPAHFVFIVGFDQGRQAQGIGQLEEGPQPVVVEDGADEEHSRRAQGPGFINLVFVDDEILAQDRRIDGSGDFLQILRAAQEVIPFSQDGNGCGAGLFIFFGNGDVREIGSDEALRRRGLLDFTDEG